MQFKTLCTTQVLHITCKNCLPTLWGKKENCAEIVTFKKLKIFLPVSPVEGLQVFQFKGLGHAILGNFV